MSDLPFQTNAQVLVSGDRRHLLSLREYAGVRIVGAAAFLEALEQRESDGKRGHLARAEPPW